ncbi:hypothetical protein ACN28S_47055 [Cystobacter fuscus]
MVVGVCALVAYSASVAGSLGFEPDMRKLRGEFAATRLDDHIIAQLGRRHAPTVFLTPDVAQAERLASALRELEARHGEDRIFSEVASLSDFLPRTGADVEAERAALRAFVDGLPEVARESEKVRPALERLEALLAARPYGVEALPAEVRRRFTALDGEGSFVMAFKNESLSDTDALHRFGAQMEELREVARARGLEVQVLDSNLIAYRIFDLVEKDGPWLLLAASLAVFAMITLSLRSLRRAGLVAGPLYLGLACLPAAMHLYGLKLNFINAVVLPNLLAIAVDNAVHLYHRYREEGRARCPTWCAPRAWRRWWPRSPTRRATARCSRRVTRGCTPSESWRCWAWAARSWGRRCSSPRCSRCWSAVCRSPWRRTRACSSLPLAEVVEPEEDVQSTT